MNGKALTKAAASTGQSPYLHPLGRTCFPEQQQDEEQSTKVLLHAQMQKPGTALCFSIQEQPLSFLRQCPSLPTFVIPSHCPKCSLFTFYCIEKVLRSAEMNSEFPASNTNSHFFIFFEKENHLSSTLVYWLFYSSFLYSLEPPTTIEIPVIHRW